MPTPDQKTHKSATQLNLNVRGLPPSATLAINEHSAALQRAGRKIYRWGLGQSPFPVPDSVVAALKAHATEKDYLPVQGLPELQAAIADYNKRRLGVAVEAQDVLIGPGSKELIFLLQLTYSGVLMVPRPSWVSYAPQARIIGRPVQWIQTDKAAGWRLTAAQLDQACRLDPHCPRLLILNYPGNPTGLTYAATELEEIAAVARKYGVVVLSDEIYGELDFSGQHRSIAQHYPEGTIISGGLSKWCGAGGWRLGCFSFPRALSDLRQAMAAVASETYTSVAAPIQFAGVTAYQESDEIESYLDASRKVLSQLADRITADLQAAQLNVFKPQGAFYIFPDFEPLRAKLANRSIRGSSELCHKLLDELGLACLPGAVFGRSEDELTVRMAFVDFDGGAALDLARGNSPLNPEAFAPNIVASTQALQEWCAAL